MEMGPDYLTVIDITDNQLNVDKMILLRTDNIKIIKIFESLNNVFYEDYVLKYIEDFNRYFHGSLIIMMIINHLKYVHDYC